MSRRRAPDGYEQVSGDDDDSYTEAEALLPGSRASAGQTTSTEAYYDENHLSETFTEQRLEKHFDTWALKQMARDSARKAAAVTCHDVGAEIKRSCQFLHWLPQYNIGEYLVPDLMAGVTVGVVVVAQGVAYGLLTGLPAYYGLYASIPPAAIYAMLGTSRQMHIGPFALVSLLVAEGVTNAGIDPDDDMTAYIDAVMTMSLICSAIYLTMWVCHLGVVVEILSDPTMSAMTTAAAFLICTSQMRHFFGLSGIPRGTFLETWGAIILKLPDTNWICVAIAVASLAIQLGIAKLNKKLKLKAPIPEQLVVVVLTTWLVWQFSLDTACFDRMSSLEMEDMDEAEAAMVSSLPPCTSFVTNNSRGGAITDCPMDRCVWDPSDSVSVLGVVPQGLPSLYIPNVSSAPDILEGAVVVAVVSIALCIATAKTFADKNGYEIDTNQELLALGVSNLVGGLFQSYPAASSLSRSALAQTVGAKTQLWNIFCCAIVAVVLLFLVPLLRCLPNAALAAIILIAFKSIIKQLSEVKRLWALSKPDCFVWIITFAACLAFGVKLGIACGVIASLGGTLTGAFRPYHALLGRLPKTEVYRDVQRYPDAIRDPGIVAFRFDGPIVFANRDFFKSTLLASVRDQQELDSSLQREPSYNDALRDVRPLPPLAQLAFSRCLLVLTSAIACHCRRILRRRPWRRWSRDPLTNSSPT